MWLRDALPRDLPKARVLIYGYESTVAGSESFQNLGDIASSFRASLKEVTSNMTLMRPFIFIAHSLGGLVLKQALLQMAISEDEDDARHLKETFDILFFGVPNQGMELSSLYPMAHGQLNMAFLSTLDRNSVHLQNLVTEFNRIVLSDTRIMSFYETCTSPTARQESPGRWSMSGEHAVLVDRYSATSSRSSNKTHPINRNHSDMVKFRRMDNVYNTVRGYLKKSAKHAPAVMYNESKKLLANPSTSTPVEPQEYPSVNVQNPQPTRSVSNLPETNDVTTLRFRTNEFSASAENSDISSEAVNNGTRPISNLPESSDEITTPFRTEELSTSIESLDISREAVIGRAVARTDQGVSLEEQQRALQALSTAGFKMKNSQFSLDEALPWAVQHGNEAVVRWLLQEAKENPADIGLYFPLALDRQPLLNIAASENFQSIAWLLLDWGANINAKNWEGQTALHRAAWKGHEAIVLLLLERGADINANDVNEFTSLHHAAEYGHEAIVHLLLKRDADINAKTQLGMTALHLAASCKHEATLRLLLERDADINAKPRSRKTALHLTAVCEHEAIVRLLLEEGADIDAKDLRKHTSLHIAAQYGHEAIVHLLLERDADINAKSLVGQTALHCAAGHGHEATVHLLLERGADINVKTPGGETALHCAAGHGHEATVHLLLERDADINAKCQVGQTALHRAAEHGHEATVHLLLERGADINVKTPGGGTALHDAAQYGHKAIVCLLLERGADINVKAEHGGIALHYAVYQGYEAIARLLLENGSDIHAIHANGKTALHIAMSDGNMRIVHLLLKKGANPNARNYLHETPLDVARKKGKMTVVKLLEPLTR